jgi:hypothetical protein
LRFVVDRPVPGGNRRRRADILLRGRSTVAATFAAAPGRASGTSIPACLRNASTWVDDVDVGYLVRHVLAYPNPISAIKPA